MPIAKDDQKAYLKPLLICLALAAITVVAFWPIKDCDFISMDDNIYVYENVYVQSGFSWDSIGQIFSFELPKTIGHWHPLTWLSLMLDHSIFGLNPFGYHLTNLLFHVLNTILLFLVLRRMTKALWASAFVAALFAIHPLHVESVAWVTERKDVLSTFFMMLTLGAYSYYVEHWAFKRYAFVLLFFALGLMSKPMLVTLPFVLLLLDFWPLRRFSQVKLDHKLQPEVLQPVVSEKQKRKTKNKDKGNGTIKEVPEVIKMDGSEPKWSLIYPIFLEKIPLFALAVLSCIATFIAAHSAGSVGSIEQYPLFVRIGNACISYVAYIWKMVLPINLAIFYPYSVGVILWQVIGAVLMLIAITVGIFWMSKRSPYLATGWLWYLGTLVPVIGIVQAGSQAMADRYTYIPMIGLFIMLAWGVPELFEKWAYRKQILLALSVLSILSLTIMTAVQAGYWRDSLTLYDHAIAVTNQNMIAYINRGTAHQKLGNNLRAIEDFNKAIEIKPDFEKAYNNRGHAYQNLGHYRQAIEDLNKAIEIKPGYADAYYNRGIAYNGLGDYRQAIEDYGKAIEINPRLPEAYNNRGNAYGRLGRYDQAIIDFDRAIEIKPAYAEAYMNRGNANSGLGSYPQALKDYDRAIEIKPDYAMAYMNRSIAYVNIGKNDLAVHDLKMAARLGDERARNLLKRDGVSWEIRN